MLWIILFLTVIYIIGTYFIDDKKHENRQELKETLKLLNPKSLNEMATKLHEHSEKVLRESEEAAKRTEKELQRTSSSLKKDGSDYKVKLLTDYIGEYFEKQNLAKTQQDDKNKVREKDSFTDDADLIINKHSVSSQSTNSYKLCLFDLDDTLLLTKDLESLRKNCLYDENGTATDDLLETLENDYFSRHIFEPRTLEQMRSEHPELKLGVFTRAPKIYVKTLLGWAYPNIEWDVIVTYEDVYNTKPHGEGVEQAMDYLGIENPREVILVGDSDVDMRAAYNSGCVAIRSEIHWYGHQQVSNNEQWRAANYIADGTIKQSIELIDILKGDIKLPMVEAILNEASNKGRFDIVNHWLPWGISGSGKPYPIYVGGRLFTLTDDLEYIRNEHKLTHAILDSKDSDYLPDSWVQAIRMFIKEHIEQSGDTKLLITTIPARPGRKARLDILLNQVLESIDDDPIDGFDINIATDLLRFSDGVLSQHHDRLNRDERYHNIKDHLYVNRSDLAREWDHILIIDDVVTTGSSLIVASNCLEKAGAKNIKRLALAKSIS